MINVFGIVIALEITAIAAMVAAVFAPVQLWDMWGLTPPAWSRAGMQRTRRSGKRKTFNPQDFSEMG